MRNNFLIFEDFRNKKMPYPSENSKTFISSDYKDGNHKLLLSRNPLKLSKKNSKIISSSLSESSNCKNYDGSIEGEVQRQIINGKNKLINNEKRQLNSDIKEFVNINKSRRNLISKEDKNLKSRHNFLVEGKSNQVYDFNYMDYNIEFKKKFNESTLGSTEFFDDQSISALSNFWKPKVLALYKNNNYYFRNSPIKIINGSHLKYYMNSKIFKEFRNFQNKEKDTINGIDQSNIKIHQELKGQNIKELLYKKLNPDLEYENQQNPKNRKSSSLNLDLVEFNFHKKKKIDKPKHREEKLTLPNITKSFCVVNNKQGKQTLISCIQKYMKKRRSNDSFDINSMKYL